VSALARHLQHLASLPVEDYVVRPRSRIRGAIYPRSLDVGLALSPRPAAAANEQWEKHSTRWQLDLPLFEWESIAAFRPDDPILLIRAGNVVQALMQFREGHETPCPLGARPALVYISFLEVAPWNRIGIRDRRYKGLGQLMLCFASQRSLQLGFDGRIGLHALPAAEAFYRRLGFDAPVCPNEYRELYFELGPEGARNLLEGVAP